MEIINIKWEYKVVRNLEEDELNLLGSDGWELINIVDSVNHDVTYVLKKMVVEEDKKPCPKFKVGDRVRIKPIEIAGQLTNGYPFVIMEIKEDRYVADDGMEYFIYAQEGWELCN